MVHRLCPATVCRAAARLTLVMALLGGSAAFAQAVIPLPPSPPDLNPSSVGVPPAPPSRGAVVLQGLDKVTARISTFEVPIDREARFGTLSIVVRSCQKTPPTEPPESAAFIQIDEAADGDPRRLFSGWMFASSPALSALEHPVYDIWVLECKNAANASSANSE